MDRLEGVYARLEGPAAIDAGARSSPRQGSRFSVSAGQISRLAHDELGPARSPSPSRSTIKSHKKALLVIFAPVSLSVDLVELFRSIALGGGGGGNGDMDLRGALPETGVCL